MLQNTRDGVRYSSFKDFAFEELGMGEDYRDYLAVGRVIREHRAFIFYLTDIDTEETFLKLRYLPDALKTHHNNEPLVLARLRSLTVREFKTFSICPDFEITFTKRLTKKRMDEFMEEYNYMNCKASGLDGNIDFIEAYNRGEKDTIRYLVSRIVWKELSPTSVPSSTADSNTPDQEDGITSADDHETLDNPGQQDDLTA